MLTFVYYFNPDPKQFTGGELRIYDGEVRDGQFDAAETFHLIEPVDNSIIFFPSFFHHEVLPVHTEVSGLAGCRFTVNGWYRTAAIEASIEEGGGFRVRTVQDVDPDERTNAAQRILPSFTEHGYAAVDTPAEVQKLLIDEFERRFDKAVAEDSDPVYLLSGDPDMVRLPDELGHKVLELLKPVHEEWSGVALEPRAAYGIRVYRDGQTLKRHTDRVDTHVISSIVHVSADVDEPWPITIEDVDGNAHDIVIDPGQMLLYESAKCPHARNTPMVGRHFASVFVHYQPKKGWNWTEADLRREMERAATDPST